MPFGVVSYSSLCLDMPFDEWSCSRLRLYGMHRAALVGLLCGVLLQHTSHDLSLRCSRMCVGAVFEE